MNNQNIGLTILIVVLCIVGAVALVTGYVLLDKYIFSKKRCKRNLKTLERKYEYLHALLTGQDFQYVQRIEIISRTNLLYSDIYSVYFKRYKDIRDIQETAYNEILNKLVLLVDKSDVKAFKKLYKSSLSIFTSYEEAVNTFNNDLTGVIKPEEDARQNSLVLKDEFRDVKSKYNSHEKDLEFVNDTFIKVFDEIDQRFTKFEGFIETANYDEANDLLPEIKDVLKACNELIDKIPDLIKRCNDIIPVELKAASDHYDSLIKAEYPLKHVGFEAIKNNIELSLDQIGEDIKGLKINNCLQQLDELDKQIKNVEDAFKKEEDARSEFDGNSERIYGNFNNLEKEFIKVRNNLEKYSKYYIVDENHLTELKNIQKELDDVSKDKRRLDMYVHSLEKTPYSVLILKMRDLDKGTSDIFDRFNKFKDYLASLKTDTESAFRTINDTYFKLKEIEESLRYFYNNDFSDKFNDDIDKSYDLIDQIYILLKSVPINVNAVNDCILELNDKSGLISSRVGDAKKYRDLDEEEIMFMNRERVKFSDVNVQLSQAENLFINGEYAQCYQMTESVLNKINEKDALNQ